LNKKLNYKTPNFHYFKQVVNPFTADVALTQRVI